MPSLFLVTHIYYDKITLVTNAISWDDGMKIIINHIFNKLQTKNYLVTWLHLCYWVLGFFSNFMLFKVSDILDIIL